MRIMKELNKLQNLIQIMSFQKNDQSDFDFSIIDKKPPQQAKLNFSVESLLSEHSRQQQNQQKSTPNNRNNEEMINNDMEEVEVHQVHAENGSFLQDLQKLEQQLSFETQLYNVYQQETQNLISNSLNPLTKSYLHAKSNSHLKTTKQQSNNEPTQPLDDYGYLVLDFTVKRKKSSKLHQNQKTHNKVHHNHAVTMSHKLKTSRSSCALTENISEEIQSIKSKNKKTSLNRLFSPKIINNRQLLGLKQKNTSKSSKLKQIVKQGQKTGEKTTKKLSKSKSPSNKLNYNSIHSKKTNVSTTIAQSISKTNKSMREANAYSQYYGFEQIGVSDRLITKSNCFSSAGSEKNVSSGGIKNILTNLKKSHSKSKCKKSFHSPSPSNKDLALRFKKKKAKQCI